MTSPVLSSAPAPAPAPVRELLERSRDTLVGACRTTDASERYIDAHLGALRAGAALLARFSPPPTRRAKPQNVWQALPVVLPELAEWAQFFAGAASVRAQIGRGGYVGTRQADDMLRQAEMFLEIAQDRLGVPITVPLPELITPARPMRHPATTDIPA